MLYKVSCILASSALAIHMSTMSQTETDLALLASTTEECCCHHSSPCLPVCQKKCAGDEEESEDIAGDAIDEIIKKVTDDADDKIKEILADADADQST